MQYGELSKMMIMHFVIAVIITLMISFALSTVKMDNLAYLGLFFGIYVFAGYGVNRLIEEKIIEKKSHKIILVIVCIIVFYLFFAYLMPMFFNMNMFGNIKIGNALLLTPQLMFAIFSIIVLVLSLR